MGSAASVGASMGNNAGSLREGSAPSRQTGGAPMKGRRSRSSSVSSSRDAQEENAGRDAAMLAFEERVLRRTLVKLQFPPEKIDVLVPALRKHIENPESHNLETLLPESEYVRNAIEGGVLKMLAAAREVGPFLRPSELEAAADKSITDQSRKILSEQEQQGEGQLQRGSSVIRRLWRRRSSRENKYRAADTSPTVSPTTSNSTVSHYDAHTPDPGLLSRQQVLPQRLPPVQAGTDRGAAALQALAQSSGVTDVSVSQARAVLPDGLQHEPPPSQQQQQQRQQQQQQQASGTRANGRATLPALLGGRRRSSRDLAAAAADAAAALVASSTERREGAALVPGGGGVVSSVPLASGESGGSAIEPLRRKSSLSRRTRRTSDSSSESTSHGQSNPDGRSRQGLSVAPQQRGSASSDVPALAVHVRVPGEELGATGGAADDGGDSSGGGGGIVLFGDGSGDTRVQQRQQTTYRRTGVARDAAADGGFDCNENARDQRNSSATDSAASAQQQLQLLPTAVYHRPYNFRAPSERSMMGERAMVTKGMWKLGHQIGKGSFGDVHIGLNEASGDLIAVKILPLWKEELRDRVDALAREFELMRTLKHENIVRYLGAEVNDEKGEMCIFQEWVPGSVTSLLDNFGPFSEVRIVDYTRQILEGLSYLHRQRVLHRDIKGSNILIDDRGVVKLCDFGASKNLNEIVGLGSHTRVGSPLFMAPEILLKEEYGPKIDIWSLGGAVLEMATGHPPWHALNFRTPVALINWVRKDQGPPPIPPTLSPLLNAFLLSCFQRDPNKRPTAEELLRDEFLARPPASAMASSSGQSGRPPMVHTESVSDLEGMPITEAKERIRRASVTYNKSESSLLRRGYSVESMTLDAEARANAPGSTHSLMSGENNMGNVSSAASTPLRSPSSRQRAREALSRSVSSAESTPAASPERQQQQHRTIMHAVSMPELAEEGEPTGSGGGGESSGHVAGRRAGNASGGVGDRAELKRQGDSFDSVGDESASQRSNRSPSGQTRRMPMPLTQQLSVDTNAAPRVGPRRASTTSGCIIHCETPLSGSHQKHSERNANGSRGQAAGGCTCAPATPASPGNPWSGRRRRSATPGGSSLPNSGASTPAAPSSPVEVHASGSALGPPPSLAAAPASVPATPSSSNPFSGRVRSPRRASRSADTSPMGSRDGTRRRKEEQEHILGRMEDGVNVSSTRSSTAGSPGDLASGGSVASTYLAPRLTHIREVSGAELSERLEDMLRQSVPSNSTLDEIEKETHYPAAAAYGSGNSLSRQADNGGSGGVVGGGGDTVESVPELGAPAQRRSTVGHAPTSLSENVVSMSSTVNGQNFMR